MTDQLPTPLTIDSLRTRPANVADAIERQARIDAVRDYLGTVREEIRDTIRVQADATEAATGAAFNAPVKGVGRAYRTDPAPSGRITDPEAFADYVIEAGSGLPVPYAELVEAVTSVRIRDERALLSVLDDAPEDDPAADGWEWYRELTGCLTIETRWVASDSGLSDLVDAGRIVYREDDEGGWRAVDTTTGETVPGVSVSRAKPTLTVTIEPARKRALAAELSALLGPPALAGNVESD